MLYHFRHGVIAASDTVRNDDVVSTDTNGVDYSTHRLFDVIDSLSGNTKHELARTTYIDFHRDHYLVSTLIELLNLRVEPINDDHDLPIGSNMLSTDIYGTHLLGAVYNDNAIANYDGHVDDDDSEEEDPNSGVTSTKNIETNGASAYTTRNDFVDRKHITIADKNAMLTNQHLNILFYSAPSHHTDALIRSQLYGLTAFPGSHAAWLRHFNALRIVFSFYTLRLCVSSKISP